ncbi:MAG: hypothetical protein JWM95_2269 [Gemmatimonadetes bacterium]|nr:hypothetical protein [Gemmatimonadota bacterium]
MPLVSRRARLVDLAALCCIAAGVAIFVGALSRFGEIAKLSYRHPGPPNQSALAAADHARYLAYGGVLMVIAGCVIAVTGAVRVARNKRSP